MLSYQYKGLYTERGHVAIHRRQGTFPESRWAEQLDIMLFAPGNRLGFPTTACDPSLNCYRVTMPPRPHSIEF